MSLFENKTLAVIGAGPKGLAVGVKAKVLAEMGLPADQVFLIEKNKVAAHWSGEFGFTNGDMKLGTSPEKDLVFPLETQLSDPQLTKEIRSRLMEFTWVSYLVQTDQHSDWIDRGRPAPSHRQWASYLRWVADRLAPQVTLVKAEVLLVDLDATEKKWELQLRTSAGEFTSLKADRLMLTEPGQTRMDFSSEGHLPNTYDLTSFWEAIRNKNFRVSSRMAIVGAGENAASILLALGPYFGNVDVISPKGFIVTRAENYYENKMYTQPDKNSWTELDIEDRLDFIDRTDLGVFSVQAMQILNEQSCHKIIPGRLIDMKNLGDGLELTLEYRNRKFKTQYDQVILATGFDQVANLKKMFSLKAQRFIEKSIQAPLLTAELMARIQSDLSLKGVLPHLHLPMLAGPMQGPGFANLSCLGKLADRVLMPHLQKQKVEINYEWETVVR